MDRFRVQGPCRLSGSVRAGGAKNAALPALAATLLTDDPVRLTNLPDVADIRTMLRLLECLGKAWEDGGGVRLLSQSHPQPQPRAPYDLVKTMRASVLVLGPLLARRGEAEVSLPGGCAIGVRPIDQHLAGLEAMGAEVRLEGGYVRARCRRLRGCRYRFQNPTVTGTENLLMAATLAAGTTVLDNCAREPEVVDLARLLRAMGARIDGAGDERIEVEGVAALSGAEHRIIADRIEAGTYLVAGAITAGSVVVEDADDDDLGPLLEKLHEAGANISIREDAVAVDSPDGLAARDVVTAPHPGFPTDLQAQYMALMTQARGVATVCETVFENRFQHVAELNRMGAEIRVDGHFAHVHGPARLSGANVMATDLRASACLVLAALAAHGETTVHRIYHLDRGYSKMELKLQALGATVERLSASVGT